MDRKLLWKLFISTLYLSAFTFGGGYVIVTLMKKKFVDDYKWISEKEMLNFVAIAQSAPGAIAVNGAIVVGFKLAGLVGALVAVIGTVIPPFVIISLISFAYDAFRANIWISLMLEGMQAGVGAVVTAVSYEMAAGVVKEKDTMLILMMLVAFIANTIFNVNVIIIILVSIVIGLVQSFFISRKENAQ
ncbi:chromate transporter [Carnobacteriaceae bacterium 52-44]|jgi:chromate transporter